jgi:hypothetical protein
LFAGLGIGIRFALADLAFELHQLHLGLRLAALHLLLGRFEGRGFVDAFDVRTGERKWRFYTAPSDPSKPQDSPLYEMAKEGIDLKSIEWAAH